MLSTRYSVHLHITRPPQGPRVHEIHWAAICTAWSRISRGNAPVKTIGATVESAINEHRISNQWNFSESATNEFLTIVSNLSAALAFFGMWYVIYCSFGRQVGRHTLFWQAYPLLLSFCRFELPWFDFRKTVLWAGILVPLPSCQWQAPVQWDATA